jgi:hypothetical protein
LKGHQVCQQRTTWWSPQELYNHANDPHEWTNLATVPAQAAVKQKLRSELCQRVGMTPPMRSASAPPVQAAAAMPMEDDGQD